ncbi:hypothetical protein ONZ45_g8535 [Pleurotus djamor]|nr:hypothetical protein ONZ45_g8535 [Pleurotus djamor]
MHHIVLPLFYETLLIIDPDRNPRRIHRGYEPSTRIPYTLAHLLKRTLVTHPHLSAHIKAVIDVVDSAFDHHPINDILPLLTHLKRLYRAVPFAIEDFMGITSPHLAYIRFARNAYDGSCPYTPTDVQTLFNQYPSLRIVDIDYKVFYMHISEVSISRYRRDELVQEEIPLYLNKTFELWWEPLEEELDCF